MKWRDPRLRPFAAAMLFGAFAIAMFAPLFRSHAFFLWDVPDEYWPDLQYMCGALHDHVWPLWNPYDRGGYPFVGDPQVGLYYPLNHAICAVAGRSPSLFWAEIRVVFHFALAGCAMTAFLRAIDLPWSAAIGGGLMFMLAPYQRRMWEVNLSYTIAYLPAILLAIERLAQLPTARRSAMLALMIALATSVGSPPSLFFTVVTCAVYAIARCARHRDTWVWLLIAGLVAVSMSAIVVVPGIALSRESVQQAKDYASISAGGDHFRDFVGIAWPGHHYLYLGVPAIVLVLYELIAPRSVLPRSVRICFGALTLFALGMMLGDHGPFFRLAFRIIPGVSAFRSPLRYSAIFGACAAILAAGGIARLRERSAWAWLSVAIVVGVLWPALPPDRDLRNAPQPGADTSWNAFRARMDDVESSWRIHDEFGVGLRAGTRHRARDLRGYQDPLQLERYSHVINSIGEFPHLLEQFNVRYILRGPHFIHGTSHHFLPDGTERLVARDLGGNLWETNHPLPAAYWVSSAEFVSDPEQILTRLEQVAPSPVCIVEQPFETDTAASTSVSWRAADRVHLDRSSLEVQMHAPLAGWLVVNEAYDPSWTAECDGHPVDVLRANYWIRAVHVPSGNHRVVFRYRVRHYNWLIALALLGLVTSLALIALNPGKFRRIGAPSPKHA